jgi:hypothetical protein
MWLSVGAARAASAPADTVVLVDTSAVRVAPPAKSQAKAAPVARAFRPAPRWRTRPVQPTSATTQVVVRRYRYLQHCALLL